jgi:hypothetical protein
MIYMRVRFAPLCAVLALPLLSPAADAGLTQVRNVYLLPMSGGLDQFIAGRLAAQGRYNVVTDPEQADALITDRIGADFEERFAELYPPPPPPNDEKEKKAAEEPSVATLFGESAGGRRISSFGRGKGNVFLIDRGSKRVLWSTWLRPRGTRPDDLHRSAETVVDRLDEAARIQVKRMQRDETSAKPAPPK